MIRDYSRRTPRSFSLSKHLPLLALLAATGGAALLACSSDDGDDDQTTESAALEPVEPTDVPERAAPAAPAAPEPLPPGSDTLNGLSLPGDMANWRVIGVVNVQNDVGESQTVRAIVGNAIAVDAARSGQTNPWPEGTMMGHLQWTSQPSPRSGSTATVPDAFAAATLMIKNTAEYAEDGGWAYGVWTGSDLRPLPDPNFDQGCVDCHTADVQDKDYVFTIPGALPTQAAVDAAPVMPNGVELPADILDWRVIGIASRENDMNGNIRVIVGNDIAVEAARSGNTNPWPEGTQLAHYVWAAGPNEDAPNTVNPVAFNQFTLIVKDTAQYGADFPWAFGAWSGDTLTAPADAAFDQSCIDCHTSNVPDSDFVFTIPGDVPDALFGG